MKSLALALAVVLLASPVLATCGGGGGGGVGGMSPRGGGSFRAPRGPEQEMEVYQVPWKSVGAGDPAPAGALVLYWFPRSKQEEQSSDLQSSRQLTLAAARCVALAAVPADNAALREKLGAKADTELAVLVVAADGGELGRTAAKYGRPLSRGDVEDLVRQGMKRHERAADAQLASAAAKEEQGDKDGAAAIYARLWAERCFADGPAKKAAKAMEKLGRPLPDASSLLTSPAPDERPATEKAIAHALASGLRAEDALRLDDALKAYEAARQLDPADPVPLRFLGELHRHHTGDWAKARAAFQQILAMPADPLSRAVALHGLGKMTIHDGESAKGLALFEQSIAAYPLALTYRNLAVYWSSEGNAETARGYVEKAMALEPRDEYNQIFAATFLVKLGRPAEAARIASEHESLLPASYNLAAIWAQLGDRDRALSLLRRHFYAYERRDAVRRREMHEARVDIVFASLKQDPAFVALTALADGGDSRMGG